MPRSGYGSQALALKYIGAKFEHWKICEWAINSIIAYADLHRNELPFYGKDWKIITHLFFLSMLKHFIH